VNAGLREFARFCLVGSLGFALATAILYAMLALGAGFYGGYAIAFVATVTATWWLNRGFTFGDRSEGMLRQWARFMLSNAAAGVVNYAAFAALIAAYAPAREQPVLATAVGALAGLAVNFLAAKHLVFRGRLAARIEMPPRQPPPLERV
jgi:putative flippase GtrA